MLFFLYRQTELNHYT